MEQITTGEGQNFTLPAVNLPKGGGSINGIGEKFSVNACNGTGSTSIPISLTPARDGFTPQLSLTYDSGNGNNCFGYGWGAGVGSISRKTSRGIPLYNDQTDTYLLSGMEDLVPHLQPNGDSWNPLTRKEGSYQIVSYRPRIEGLFSRIEKWQNIFTGEEHWKTVSKANVTSVYGSTADYRVFDPEDERRVFQWMIERSFDAKGNIIIYQYKRENAEGIDTSLSYEGNRVSAQTSFNQLYLKSVHYGNKTAMQENDFHFHLLFDYGEHEKDNPSILEEMPWSLRKDPFSSFRSGFEIRQYRLCRRLLLFHEFEELGDEPMLVRSIDISYSETENASLLTAVQQHGYKKAADGKLSSKSFPPVSFSYSECSISNEVKTIEKEWLDNVPAGVDGDRYQWVDLEGEGLPGIFTESAGAWYYKHNRGAGTFTSPRLVAEIPRSSFIGEAVFSDVDADGSLELVLNGTTMKGYAEQHEKGWDSFLPFETCPAISPSHPDLKYIDLNGDGFADILVSEDEVFTWYPSKGKKGWGDPECVRKSLDEESGPTMVFSDPEQCIYLADMTGAGLNDVVRIRNGEIAYWPNTGYGKFGAKIIMENAPRFDAVEQFSQQNIRLFDVNGTGTTDVLYCAGDIIKIWYNYSGNCWSEAAEIRCFPQIDRFSSISITDLLGKGTGCLVWSTSLPSFEDQQFSYIDLMQEGKPYLMTSINNNLGKEILVEYGSSTEFYLEDLLQDRPWVTRLNFPVHVMKKITVTDQVSSSRLVTSYRYHHGYYDGEEREFRGFGMVEQTDSESFDTYKISNELDMPPVYTRTWFHLGAYVKQGAVSQRYKKEYYAGDPQKHELPENIVETAAQFGYEDLREAHRALKGQMLRQELYALDGTTRETVPYSITESNFRIQQLQPGLNGEPGVYLPIPHESIVYSYERNEQDPRIAHSVQLETDAYGQPLKTIKIAYPRRSSAMDAYAEQQQLYVTAQTSSYFNEEDDFYLIGVLTEQKNYEINGLLLPVDACFFPDDLARQLENTFEASAVLFHHQLFTGGVQARLIGWTRNHFWNNDMTAALFGEASPLALLHNTEQISMSSEWVGQVYASRLDDAMMQSAGWLDKDSHWWNPGPTVFYLDSASFYLPYKTVDAFGNQSLVYYDGYSLAAVSTEDALGNSVIAEIDYRTVSIKKITDINENVSESITDALGMVIATTVYGSVNGIIKGDSPIDAYVEQSDLTLQDIVTNPGAYLQQATSFFYYNLEAWMNDHQPPHFINLLREKHSSELNGEQTPIQVHLGYSDGFGHSLQQKLKAGTDDNGNEQWLVTGRTVYNNKEKPVKQYEPFYSNTYAYQDEEEVAPVGVTPVIYYDPLGRMYRKETPKGFHSKTLIDSWQLTTYDLNDTVKDAVYYQEHIGSGDEESAALEKAEAHYNTPTVQVLDSLARQFMTMQYKSEGGAALVTFSVYDIRGNQLRVTDPRQWAANQNREAGEQVHNFEYMYDLKGNKLSTKSVDAGESLVLMNVLGKPVHTWIAREYHTLISYDELQRPVEMKVEGNGLNQVLQRFEYGDLLPGASDKNLKGQCVNAYDQAGLVENELFDFKGRLLKSARRLRVTYKTEANWNEVDSVPLQTEVFSSEIAYDALDRIVEMAQPDGSVVQAAYHEAGWLKNVAVQLKGEAAYTPVVESISYNPKGQRIQIIYGNGVHTNYEYESTTFRLLKLFTTRQESGGSITTLQDISYSFDPVGNIVKITDNSFEKVFTANQQVSAAGEYVYDPLYQLLEAKGREHMALSKTDYQQQSDIYKSVHWAGINDANQLRNYTRQFNYDDAGNLVQMKHIGENSFTRDFLVSGISNRAITGEMNGTVDIDAYFDAAGNMNQLEHLQGIEWNYRNNIASITVVERETGNDTEYYVYDAAGQRTRKIKETYNSTGILLYKEEKIYLGNVEIKRRYQGTTETLLEDRSTLHIMDDKKRIAIAYYWATSNDSSVTIGENKMHYQLGNHLGSAAMELDKDGLIISYEEYFPFGETAFTTGSNAAEVALKEYRYSGKERDDTTALYYYGARYYASWMGRWLSPDPAGTVDGLNVYLFVGNNPMNLIDPDGLDKCSPGEFKGFDKLEGQYFEVYESDETVCLPSPMILVAGDAAEAVYPGDEAKIAPGSLLVNPLEDPLNNDDVKATIDQMDTYIGWMELGAKGLFAFLHPWKTWQHIGPKQWMGTNLGESEDLIAAYPNLLAEIGLFYAETGTTPIVEVIAGLRVVNPANKERLYREFIFRKEMITPLAEDLPVIENMFGDPRQTTGYNEFYWGNLSIVGEEVNVVKGPGAPAHQFKLTVTDSLGLQGNEPAPIVWFHSFGIIGGSNIILGEIYVGIDANGTAQILPWSTVSPPVYGYPEKSTMAPVRLPGR